MTPSDAIQFTTQALWLAFRLSMPAVLAATLVSLGIAILQATTQVQDQTIGQTARVLTVVGVLVLTGASMGAELVDFGKDMFDAVARVR